ncbi:MAG TPA: phospholipase D-like domain-containing protein [Methanocorpusculum sp.]|nr:phospholipase D-like domain-containing protein [Methanocorpusculum sp.]HJJ53239.1 phospholipase D-like domain-containing protein [Methanocorpusculum sp.]
MKRLFLLLLVLALCISPVSAFDLVEFCPDGYASGDGDEYFILEGVGSLAGWTISDGEGVLSFPSGAVSNGRIVVARSAAAYYQIHKTLPNYEIIESGTTPNIPMSGKFQMANTGDTLSLLSQGTVVQTVSWPNELAASNGRIHVYSKGVWDDRIYKIGQSRFYPETFNADSVTLFVSPDCSYSAVIDVIRKSTDTLLISMYEFTHADIAREVAYAANRGVKVTLLLEGGPVGGISEDQKGVMNYLTENGVSVWTIKSEGKLPARYRYLHAKYFVADDYVTVVISENFKPTGIPLPETKGNRGWGTVVRDAEVAGYFTAVFADDISGYDIHRYATGNEPLPNTQTAETITPHFSEKTLYDVIITPVISPDTSGLVSDLIKLAKKSIDVQQAYISPYPNGENVWLAELLSVADRGAKLRVILDGMYYNTDGATDNDELVATLNRRGGTVSAKLLSPGSYLTKVHNKGMIVDDEYVLISSINWNYNSPNNNREAGLILHSAEAAEYYSKVFSFDWNGDFDKDPLSAGIGFDVRYLLAGGVVILLIGILIYRRRI